VSTAVAPLYHSSRIFDFQAEGVARAYLRDGNFAIWSTGIGKTHLAMMLAALLFEDGEIDLVLVACESGKLSEWVGDFRYYTGLTTALYKGKGPDDRRAMLVDPPQVLVSTYETIRNDAAMKVKGAPKKLQDGFLRTALKKKRVLVIYDEATKLRNRDSDIYRYHEHLLRNQRKEARTRVLALTATPFERSPESGFNIGRLVSPQFCTVKQFEDDHYAGVDFFGNVTGYKNIGPDDHVDSQRSTLFEKLEHCLLVKDKFDDDVRGFFPAQTEEFTYVDLPPKLRAFYNEVVALADDDDLAHLAVSSAIVLRQAILHPRSLLRSKGKLARALVEAIGPKGLAALPVPKLDALANDLERLVRGERRKILLYTFFGQTVLPELYDDLAALGYNVAINHGGLSKVQRDKETAWFKEGDADIFLSSDAGARGINMPMATAVLNYEPPTLASIYQQRIDRVHRIDSEADMVWAMSYIMKDTIEEPLAEITLQRNEWFDSFVAKALAAGTKAHRPTAAERRLLMRMSRDFSETEEQ
jgi:superfamily II DNA or RNA helicase